MQSPPSTTGERPAVLLPPEYQSDTRDPARRLAHFGRLLRALVVREWKATYRRSVLGFWWAFLQPFVYLGVFGVLRGILRIPSEGLPYTLFTLSALAPWTFFSNVLNRSAPSILTSAGIIKKMDVPREVFPVAGAVTALRDFLLALVVLGAMMAWFGSRGSLPDFRWVTLLWIPPLTGAIALAGLTLGMFTASIGTYRRDILFALPLLMQFWMLASPVMYARSQVPEEWRAWYDLNPMSALLEAFRGALLQGRAPDASLLGPLAGLVALYLAARLLYRHMAQYFADVL